MRFYEDVKFPSYQQIVLVEVFDYSAQSLFIYLMFVFALEFRFYLLAHL